MTLRIGPQAPGLPDRDPITDVFSNKVGNWAYTSLFPSFKNIVSEILGRFAIGPKDGAVLTYLEDQVGEPRDLPCAHMYDDALTAAIGDLDGYEEAQKILAKDLEMRDYLRARKMEQVFS